MIPYLSIEKFTLGPLTFYTWGFFIALAFLIGFLFILKQSKRIGAETRKIFYLVIFIYFGAIVGARLFYVLQWPADFFADPSQILRIFDGGMMFYGGMLGGILAGWLFIKKLENRWAIVNIIIPVVPLAMAIGRVGCFLSNDHRGAPTGLPWAISWPGGTLRHPVALYLILFDLALFGFLLWYSRRHSEDRPVGGDEESLAYASLTSPRKMRGDSSGGLFADGKKSAFRMTNQRGQSFLVFLILYSAGRFLLDFTRDIKADPHYWGLAASQWISIILLIFLSIFLINKLTKVSKFDISS